MLWLALRRLRSKDADVRARAVNELCQFGPAASSGVLRLLTATSVDRRTREGIVESLCSARDPRIISVIAPGLHDSNRETRWSVVAILGRLSTAAALDELIAVALDPACNERISRTFGSSS